MASPSNQIYAVLHVLDQAGICEKIVVLTVFRAYENQKRRCIWYHLVETAWEYFPVQRDKV